jgi:hypothetical protein
VSLSRSLARIQAEMGIAHELPADGDELLDGEAAASHAWAAYRAGYGDDHSEEKVEATVADVIRDWEGAGREFRPCRNDAEALAAEVGNRLSGVRGYPFPSTYKAQPRRADPGLGAAIDAEQRRLFQR